MSVIETHSETAIHAFAARIGPENARRCRVVTEPTTVVVTRNFSRYAIECVQPSALAQQLRTARLPVTVELWTERFTDGYNRWWFCVENQEAVAPDRVRLTASAGSVEYDTELEPPT